MKPIPWCFCPRCNPELKARANYYEVYCLRHAKMGSVWYVIPSKRPPEQAEPVLRNWADRGYRVAIFTDLGHEPPQSAERVIAGQYPGYAQAVNHLVSLVLTEDPDCQWIVTGGDDVHPDPNHTADEIAAQCSENFGSRDGLGASLAPGTFGVMQPTGDRWGDDAAARARWPDAPAMIDRICGSPWMGRSFCERINQGRGPLWPEYNHNWVDEELQNVAIKYGCFWQRRDLTHYHDHCRRNGGPWAPHLLGADADYMRFKPLFEARQRMGFPGSEPL